MTAVFSKNELCNLAVGRLGNYEVIDIDQPTNKVEFVCKRWYNITRESALREGIFSFSVKRDFLARDLETPPFGWSYQYSVPSDSLRILSIGSDIERNKYSYSFIVERKKLYTNIDFPDGMPVRYILNTQDVSFFDSIFVEYLSLKLAYNMCFDMNNDAQLKAQIYEEMNMKKLEAESSDGHESRPVIVNNSRYKNARRSGNCPYVRRIH